MSESVSQTPSQPTSQPTSARALSPAVAAALAARAKRMSVVSASSPLSSARAAELLAHSSADGAAAFTTPRRESDAAAAAPTAAVAVSSDGEPPVPPAAVAVEGPPAGSAPSASAPDGAAPTTPSPFVPDGTTHVATAPAAVAPAIPAASSSRRPSALNFIEESSPPPSPDASPAAPAPPISSNAAAELAPVVMASRPAELSRAPVSAAADVPVAAAASEISAPADADDGSARTPRGRSATVEGQGAHGDAVAPASAAAPSPSRALEAGTSPTKQLTPRAALAGPNALSASTAERRVGFKLEDSLPASPVAGSGAPAAASAADPVPVPTSAATPSVAAPAAPVAAPTAAPSVAPDAASPAPSQSSRPTRYEAPRSASPNQHAPSASPSKPLPRWNNVPLHATVGEVPPVPKKKRAASQEPVDPAAKALSLYEAGLLQLQRRKERAQEREKELFHAAAKSTTTRQASPAAAGAEGDQQAESQEADKATEAAPSEKPTAGDRLYEAAVQRAQRLAEQRKERQEKELAEALAAAHPTISVYAKKTGERDAAAQVQAHLDWVAAREARLKAKREEEERKAVADAAREKVLDRSRQLAAAAAAKGKAPKVTDYEAQLKLRAERQQKVAVAVAPTFRPAITGTVPAACRKKRDPPATTEGTPTEGDSSVTPRDTTTAAAGASTAGASPSDPVARLYPPDWSERRKERAAASDAARAAWEIARATAPVPSDFNKSSKTPTAAAEVRPPSPVKRTPEEIAKHVKDMQARYAQAQLRIEAKKRREEESDDHCTFRPAISAHTDKMLEERRRRLETEGERPKPQREAAAATSKPKTAPLDPAARKARAEAFLQRNEKLLASRATWDKQREQRQQEGLDECTFQPAVSRSMPRDIYERLEQRRALHGGVFERLSSLSGGGRSEMGPTTYDPSTGLYFDPVSGQTFTPEEYAHAGGDASYTTEATTSHGDPSTEIHDGAFSVGLASPAPAAPRGFQEPQQGRVDTVAVTAPLVAPVSGSGEASTGAGAVDDKARDLQATLAEWRTLAGL